MSDKPPQLPPLAAQLVTMAARHLLTSVAVALVAKGVLTDGQSSQFVDIGLGLALAAASAIIASVQVFVTRNRFLQALFTRPPHLAVDVTRAWEPPAPPPPPAAQ